MKKGIYILPGLFTLINLGAGALAIIFSINRGFEASCLAVVIAIGMDIVDGRIARMTHATSRFGIELDSLADMVSFGIAPAVLMYQVALRWYGMEGIVATMLFVFAAALRLARFNSRVEVIDSGYYEGLPSPAAAGMLVGLVYFYGIFGQELEKIPFLMRNLPAVVMMLLLSFLMVSKIRYSSFKSIRPGRRTTLNALVFIVMLGLLVVAYPRKMIFAIFAAYILSGLAGVGVRRLRLRHSAPVEKEISP